MHKDIAKLLWSIHTNSLTKSFKQVPKKDKIDAIANASNTSLLFEKTLKDKTFKENPTLEHLEGLVRDTLEKFKFIAKWCEKIKKDLPFILWINHKLKELN